MSREAASGPSSYLVVTGWGEPAESLTTLRRTLSRSAEVRYWSWFEIYRRGEGSLRAGVALLSEQCPEGTVAVGWSMGAMMLLELLGSSKFGAAVLFGASEKFTAEPPFGCGRRALEGMRRRFEKNAPETLSKFYAESFGGVVPQARLDERAQRVLEASEALGTDGGDPLRAGLDFLQEFDLGDGACTIELPVLVVAAQEDQIVPPQGSIELATKLPQGSFLMAEGPHGWLVQEQLAAARMIESWCGR